MAASFNKLLLDPSADELLAALEAVSRSVGEGSRRSEWQPILGEVVENDEGQKHVQQPTYLGGGGSRYISVGWWSDHQGRKHVRVVSGNTSHGGMDCHYSPPDHD